MYLKTRSSKAVRGLWTIYKSNPIESECQMLLKPQVFRWFWRNTFFTKKRNHEFTGAALIPLNPRSVLRFSAGPAAHSECWSAVGHQQFAPSMSKSCAAPKQTFGKLSWQPKGWLLLAWAPLSSTRASSCQFSDVQLWQPSQHPEPSVAAPEVTTQALPSCDVEHTPLWPLHCTHI